MYILRRVKHLISSQPYFIMEKKEDIINNVCPEHNFTLLIMYINSHTYTHTHTYSHTQTI